MGWIIPVGQVMGHHGAIMTGSFLGTLILLERVVTFKKRWLYAFPVCSGISILFFLIDLRYVAFICLSVGAAGLIYLYVVLIRRFAESYHLIMMLGAIGYLAGTLVLISSGFYPMAVPWWIAFLLLTILGERMELSKFLPTSRLKTRILTVGIILFFGGLFFAFHAAGTYISGAGLLVLTYWLLKYDIARKSAFASGIHRFTGSLLLFGYFWLGVSGILMLFPGTSGFYYDALLHAFFLGFTFSMIFAHAPIIFPGVAGLPLKPFHNSFYLWAFLLQISTGGRIVGDLWPLLELRRFSGLMAAIVIVLYLANLYAILVVQYRKRHVSKLN
jgi:hypothetical protein